MPSHNTIRQPLNSVQGTVAFQKLRQVLSTTEGLTVIQEDSTSDEVTIRITATGNTWYRAARRKKLKEPPRETSHETTLSPVALICQMNLSHNQLEFNWVRGRDRALFESFCSHISRKVASNSSS